MSVYETYKLLRQANSDDAAIKMTASSFDISESEVVEIIYGVEHEPDWFQDEM